MMLRWCRMSSLSPIVRFQIPLPAGEDPCQLIEVELGSDGIRTDRRYIEATSLVRS